MDRPMESSWLVQRLKQPYRLPEGHRLAGVSEVFSFGGGYKNGGLTEEAMTHVRRVWSFDYMGAAEFEWGAVPAALSAMSKAELTAFAFTVPLAEVPKHWRDKTRKLPQDDAAVYVLCPLANADEVAARINAWAREEYPRLKEALRFTQALRPVEDYDRDVCGWLELDNGFLFFTDREMWESASALFGVTAQGESRAPTGTRNQTAGEPA